MIRIRRLSEPLILTENKDKWRTKYLDERQTHPKKRPPSKQYAHSDIVSTLQAMSFHKCFYCEQSTKECGAEVDHHVEVALAPDRAFDWENLYLSCPGCNQRKQPHTAIPVSACLDPCDPDVDPAAHLTFDDEFIRARGDSALGHETIRKYLLDRDDLDHKRVRQLHHFGRVLSAFKDRLITDGRKELREGEKDVLRSFRQPEHPFSLMFRIYTERLGL